MMWMTCDLQGATAHRAGPGEPLGNVMSYCLSYDVVVIPRRLSLASSIKVSTQALPDASHKTTALNLFLLKKHTISTGPNPYKCPPQPHRVSAFVARSR